MGRRLPKYRESMLHEIWRKLYIDVRSLETTGGKRVEIIDPGLPNDSDGPDFTRAVLRIEKLRWHGDVEIHREPSDWYRHNHHRDPAYNRVILHLVYESDATGDVRRQDGTAVPTLPIEPYLVQPVRLLVNRLDHTETLPCAGPTSIFTKKSFESQVRRAHKEYFVRRTEELMDFYPPDRPPSNAWKYLLITGLFDGLGISQNRKSMIRCGRHLLNHYDTSSSPVELVEEALRRSGLDPPDPDSPYRWFRKGVRPANRPETRLRQAAGLMWHILELPVRSWIREEPRVVWRGLLERLQCTPGIGRRRSRLLYAIVVLPALYLFGSLFSSSPIQSRAYRLWLDVRVPLPGSLIRVFENAGIPRETYRGKPGAAHQIKRYCRPRRCTECEVLKRAINP